MIISNKQFEALEGGVDQQFNIRLLEYAKKNLKAFISTEDKVTLERIKFIREQANEYEITTELNIARLMIICFEKQIAVPFEKPISIMMRNYKWNEYKKLEELLFFSNSGIAGLKEITVSI